MKRTFSNGKKSEVLLLASSAGLIAATYGLVRLAYGLFLPDIQSQLSLASAAAGLISAGASVMYCLGATVGFFLATQFSRSLVVAAALCAGIGAAGMAMAHTSAVFTIFAVLSSTGAGLASPSLVDLLRRNVSADSNARSQAVVNAGTGPGLVAAGLLALLLLPDWRLAWFIVAAFTILVAAAVLLLDHAGPSVPPRKGVPQVPPVSWFRDHLDIIVASFLLGAGTAAVWNFGRTHLVAAGATNQVSMTAWIALGLGGAAVIGTAPLMSALHPRTVWTVSTCAAAGASAALALMPNTTAIALLACAAFGWGYTAATSALIEWTGRLDAARAAAGTSLLFVILILGQAAGAVVLGSLATPTSFVPALLAAVAITLAATATPIGWRFMVHRRHKLATDFGIT